MPTLRDSRPPTIGPRRDNYKPVALTILESFYTQRQGTRNEELATKGPNQTLESHYKDLSLNESTISLIWLIEFLV